MTDDEYPNKCPIDDCDWWVPEGMEYLYPQHRDEKHLEDNDD